MIERDDVMEFLFEKPLYLLLFMIAIYSFANFPKLIEVLITKDNFLKNKKFSLIIDWILFIFGISFCINYISEYGFSKTQSYFIVIFTALFFVSIIRYEYNLRVRKVTKLYSRRMYYGLEDISDEIDAINEKYPQITITKSISCSPKYLLSRMSSKEDISVLMKTICAETSILKDLNSKKHRALLYFYIFLFTLSLSYLVFFGFYVISQY